MILAKHFSGGGKVEHLVQTQSAQTELKLEHFGEGGGKGEGGSYFPLALVLDIVPISFDHRLHMCG